MKKLIKELIDKKMSVYVNGEFERRINFIGLMKLLGDYSDFYQYKESEQLSYFKRSFKNGGFYIDSNIIVTIK